MLYAVNFNLHGALEPSSISVVEVETMTEVARVDTGVRPHGGRLSLDGSLFYSVNMMDFELVEFDALPRPFEYKTAFTTSFLERAYDGNALNWP